MSNEEMRELDAWIAVNVFGWKLVPWKNSDGESWPYWDGAPDESTKHCFSPTRDQSDALAVLEKCLSSDKLVMPIEIDRKRHKGGRFRIESGPMSKAILSIEDTLPLAICRFAKALFTPAAPGEK